MENQLRKTPYTLTHCVGRATSSDSAFLNLIKVEVRALLIRLFRGFDPIRFIREMTRIGAEVRNNMSRALSSSFPLLKFVSGHMFRRKLPSVPISTPIMASGTTMTWMTVNGLILIVLVEVAPLFRQDVT